MDDYKARWEQVYDTKAVDDVSWYQEHPELSLALIQGTGVAPDASIIDIGAGASLLADHLITAGFGDMSKTALGIAHSRLNPTDANLTRLVGDITFAPWELNSVSCIATVENWSLMLSYAHRQYDRSP